jgi:polysaccharide export outer membrane protein
MGVLTFSALARLGRSWAVAAAALLSGCATYPDWLPNSGPSREQVEALGQQQAGVIRLVDVDDAVARRVLALEQRQSFAETLAAAGAPAYVVGPGDTIEVSVWEAPPATLFGTTVLDPRAGSATSRVASFPEQMIAADGSINVPFAGTVAVSGKSPQQIESAIAAKLAGKANQPQVLVRVMRQASSSVTVVGEVWQSMRMPLTARGERLLDAIAAAGGVRHAVSKVTVQVTRGGTVQALPLERVIQNPKENVPLAPGDVVTALFQPLSFAVLGATGKNEEISFEVQGISLAQGLARAGGLQDARADGRGVFVFRFEDPQAVSESDRAGPTTPEGKVPVVYRLDLRDPGSFLVAQNFPMRNRDVVYVANASGAELQKFLNILTSSIFSASSLVDLAQ